MSLYFGKIRLKRGRDNLNKKLQVFVSSTYLDLIQERQKAVEGILRAKHIPAGMELFIPSDKSQWSIIQEWIKNSDLLLLILGGRYGSIDLESGKSYTQLEYEFALLNKIPVFAIILNKQFLANKKSNDINLNVYENETENPSIEKYNSFMKIVKSYYAREVEDINQIPTEVSLALNDFMSKDAKEYHFRGWVRGDERPNPLTMDIGYNIRNFLDEKERQGRVKDTIEMYRGEFRLFQRYFGEKMITEIGTSEIKEYLRHREDDYPPKLKSSMERIRGNLNVFFDWLVEEKIIERNPVKKVNPYKFHKKGNKALNNSELNDLRKACRKLRERALLEVLLSTGCHLSELERMYSNNIDWTNKTIIITDSRERERVAFLTIQAETHLKSYLDIREDDLKNIFVTERRPYRQISSKGIQDEIANIARRTTISKKISPRIFRETFSGIMLDKGFQSNIVESLLGYDSKSSRSETYYVITNKNIWKILDSRPEF